MSFEEWKRENDAKVAALTKAIELLDRLRDVYTLRPYSGNGLEEVSPADMRKRANSPWDDKSGY